MGRVVAKTASRHASKRLGAHLRDLRKKAGWTQSYAGEIIGVDSVTVRRWEMGVFSPSQENIERLAELYGVQMEALLEVASPQTLRTTDSDVPVSGYIEAGVPLEFSESEPGTISLPDFIVEAHPKAFALTVSGESLSGDGIHHHDILVIDPDVGFHLGKLCIVRLDGTLCAPIYISNGELRLNTSSGRPEVLSVEDAEYVGGVVWHIRRM